MKTLILSLALLMAGSAVASATTMWMPPQQQRHTVYNCPAHGALNDWCPESFSAPLP